MADKKVDMVYLGGIGEEVRVSNDNDPIEMFVHASYEDDFVSGALITAEVIKGGAVILEKPDMRNTSFDEEQMKNPDGVSEHFESIPTRISNQETNESGVAEFKICFQEPGVTIIRVHFSDGEKTDYEDKEMVVFKSRPDGTRNEPLIVEEGDLDEAEGLVLSQLDVDNLPGSIVAEEAEEEEESMADEPRPASKLKADIEIPEDISVGGEGKIRVKVSSSWGASAAKSVTVESVSDKLEFSLPGRMSVSSNPRIVEGLTDEDGCFTCNVSHTGRISEELLLIVSWGEYHSGDQEAREFSIFIRPRELKCQIEAPKRVEIGTEPKICIQAHQNGKAVAGVPVRLNCHHPSAQVLWLEPGTGKPLESNHADTDSDGRIDFVIRREGSEPAAIDYTVEWSADGVANMADRKLEFYRKKKEEKPMTKEKKPAKKPDEKKKRFWKTDRAVKWLAAGAGMVFFAFLVTCAAMDCEGPEQRQAKLAPVAEESQDVPLSAVANDAETTPTDMSFTLEENGELEDGSQEAEASSEDGMDEDGVPETVAIDANTMTWDANGREIKIHSPNLTLKLQQAKEQKALNAKLKRRIESLQKEIDQLGNKNSSLKQGKAELQSQLSQLSKDLASAKAGAPNLDRIKVDKVVCTGEASLVEHKGKPYVSIEKCDVYLSVINK